MAVLASMVAGAMVLSSFSAPKQDASELLQVDPPTYWEGRAIDYSSHYSRPSVYIKVYEVEGQCNAYYAVVSGGEYNGNKCWVKENPDYDSSSRTEPYNKRYYITCGYSDYYFNM